MQGVPAILANSGDGSAATGGHEGASSSGGGGGGGGDVGGVDGSVAAMFGDEDKSGRGDDGDRSSAGNRWPRQETLALLKIRSDMDVAFRDSSLKGPLWEEVSRKLAELGYHRNAKKCKEKFENVFKYHKRTKEGRAAKPDSKSYRFFDQLEALESQPPTPTILAAKQPPPMALAAVPTATLPPAISPPPIVSPITVPSIPPTITPSTNNNPQPSPTQPQPQPQPQPQRPLPSQLQPPPLLPPQQPKNPSFENPIPSNSLATMSANLVLNSGSSSTSSDEETEARNRGRKRKWKEFFERLMKEVIDKQEEMQKKFLEAIEKREHDRMVREEAWKVQEMARMTREHEILVQERSIAAAKDAAVISLLQKISEQQNSNPAPMRYNIPAPVAPAPAPAPQPPQPQPPPAAAAPPAAPLPQLPQPVAAKTLDIVVKTDNGDNNITPPEKTCSSRWPKAEVEALIKLRTSLDLKYQDNGPKGPLWEEISSAMRKLGYNRNAKRCKEKWENINKYFKKVKESNKRRPEDSKTCPYFHQLDALYREKKRMGQHPQFNALMPPIMVQPEQQWPLSQDQQQHNRMESVTEDLGSENMDQNHDDEDDEDDEDDDEEEDEEEGAGGYEIVTNKPTASMGAME